MRLPPDTGDEEPLKDWPGKPADVGSRVLGFGDLSWVLFCPKGNSIRGWAVQSYKKILTILITAHMQKF